MSFRLLIFVEQHSSDLI